MPIASPEFIWQRPDWPRWSWDEASIGPQLSAIHAQRASLGAHLSALDDEHRGAIVAELMTRETVSTSAIEGVKVDAAAARSSIMRRLKLGVAPGREWQVTPQTIGLIDILADCAADRSPLTHARIKDWHQALFPAGKLGLMPLLAGEYRASVEPMQVVSATRHGEKVHYEAPPSDRLDAEMETFLAWFNDHSVELDPVLRGCLAHLWFETLHPFEDGNGRIGRAIWDLAMMQGMPQSAANQARIWAVSTAIERDKNEYWNQLERAQRGTPDVTQWLRYALSIVAASLQESSACVERVMQVTRFWLRHREAPLNARQRKALNLALSGNELDDGWLTNRRYLKLSGANTPLTASRDLAHLEQLGIIRKDPTTGGRSTRYSIVLSP
ncbi:MAG: Fic family protein [Sinimarinibacterium sp.]|jgi:Fic family protein